MRKKLSLAFGLATLLAGSGALAQEKGISDAGTFAISAERLFGYSWTKLNFQGEFEPGNLDFERETTRSQFDLLARGDVSNPFVAPRLAFDYFVINGLSVGAALAYTTFEEESETTLGNTTSTDPERSGKAFSIAPRVGYLFMFTPVIGIWPRGGFTYVSGTNETNNPTTPDEEIEASVFDLTLEGMLVLAPVPHAGFVLGPTADIPIAGSGEYKTGTTSQDLDKVRITSLGIHAGVLVWF